MDLCTHPSPQGPHIGVVLYRPGCTALAALRTGDDARRFFESTFPMFAPALRDVDLER